MKKSISGVIALSLAVGVTPCFGISNVYASTNYIVIGSNTVLKDGLVYMSFDDAVRYSLDNNLTLDILEKQIEDLEDTKIDLEADAGGIQRYDVTVTSRVWIDQMSLTYFQALLDIESAILMLEQQIDTIALATKVSIKSMFSQIIQSENNLELLKKTQELNELSYSQGEIKFKYGQISQTALDQLQSQITQTAMSISQLELQISQLYTDLNNEMGETVSKAYTVETIDNFEKYTMDIPMTNFVDNAVNSHMSVISAQNDIDVANVPAKYIVENTPQSTIDGYANDLYNARMALLAVKAEKEIAVQDAYNSLAQIEQAYNSAELELKLATDDLKTAQISYSAGNLTMLTLKQLELNVLQCEKALEQYAYNYDLQLFMLKNSSLL